MGMGQVGLEQKERAQAGRGSRWVEERNELLMTENGNTQTSIVYSRRPSSRMDASNVGKPSPMSSTSMRSRVLSTHISAMEVEELKGNKSPQGGMPESISPANKTHAKTPSPRGARVQQIVTQEAEYGQVKSSGKMGSSVEAREESSGQVRLRSNARSKGQSPRRGRVEDDDLQEVLAEIIHDQSLTLARAARRQAKITKEGKEVAQESPLKPAGGDSSQDDGVSKGVRRAKPRRQKRKADAPLAEGGIEHSELGFDPLEQFAPRSTRCKAASSDTNGWMHWDALGDVIMWRNVPRSSLLFGGGCFCMLSASYLRDSGCGFLSFFSYLALVYLGGVFLHRNFLRGAPPTERRCVAIGESELLALLRLTLPAMNRILNMFGELFGGDPSTTLKVATVLWVLAHAGYIMSLWSLARCAFVLMFIIPKIYSCYSHQLRGQVEIYAHRLWVAWNAYSHKKVAMLGTIMFAWNFSSSASCLYGAFLLLVTMKIYSRHLAEQASDQTEPDGSSLQEIGKLDQRMLMQPLVPALLRLKDVPGRKVAAQ